MDVSPCRRRSRSRMLARRSGNTLRRHSRRRDTRLGRAAFVAESCGFRDQVPQPRFVPASNPLAAHVSQVLGVEQLQPPPVAEPLFSALRCISGRPVLLGLA